MADQNGIVLITAFKSDQKLKGFQEILNFVESGEKKTFLKLFVTFVWQKLHLQQTQEQMYTFTKTPESGPRKIL